MFAIKTKSEVGELFTAVAHAEKYQSGNWIANKLVNNFMTTIFQLTLFTFVTLSFILVVGVPVIFASPNGWTGNVRFVPS